MPTFEISTQDGATYEIDAPDENAAIQALGQVHGASEPDKSIAAYTADVLSGDPARAGSAITREEGRQAGLKASTGETVAAGLQKGTLRNFSDEVAGLADASGLPVGTPPVLSAPVGGIRLGLDALGVTSGDASKRYDAMRDRARGFYEGMTDAHPVASYGSQIAGAMATPARTPLGFGADAALFGVGEGEGLKDRAIRGSVGAAGGYVAGKVLDKIMPGAPSAATNTVADAAERQGVQIPTFAATDSVVGQRAAQTVRNVPLAGDPVVKSTQTALDQLGNRAGQIADGLGGASVESAGEAASKGITGWIKGKSDALVRKAYDAVDGMVDPTKLTELGQTRSVVADILARRQNAHIAGDSKAVSQVIDAVQSRGLNYAGIKDLRTSIGEMLNGGILPEGLSGAELKRIYGALSQDLRANVSEAGGGKALAAFERANALNSQVARRREALAKVVGLNGDAAPAQVFDRILKAAGSSSRADTALLVQARKAMGADEWSGVSSAVVSRLGRDAEGHFSADRFVTDFGKLSESGKSLLFGSSGAELRRSLEDIATISSRMKDVYKKFGNPSGTAQNVVGGGLVAGLLHNPIATVSGIVGARVLAQILSRPATAKSMAAWARAYEVAVRKPSAAALSGVQSAARQFSEKAAKEVGAVLDPAKLFGGLRPSWAEGQQEKQDPR